ncbi:hypothetical protein SM866_004462 [Yersinia enterocolitica]|uniref:hypothetical protein n=1 Tax=Yersinia enterocolitica TaxID=630 RepID=UPI0029B69719|nr:hypothetical protein [Yersinia enterocolitica]EKN6271881.1 hypothetical protein [Yersinia enterocolitica]ELY5205677.1 hypothetical protein [Yersinia enterocolitica]HEI6818010.1 hypothetical protein [Yersinia enterocolitica]HEN3351258.1 hypothetical protein [Yersinia enterocolitica]
MTCIRIPNGIITITPFYRLRLDDGTCVFMAWHPYCGPTFFRDKHERRIIDDWYENSLICKALDWFIGRGERA